MTTKQLIVRCHAGLGNRIRALVSAQRVAAILDRQLAIQWTMDPYHCGAHIDCLFDITKFTMGDIDESSSVEFFSVGKGPTFIPDSDSDIIHVLEENFFWCEKDRNQGVIWGQLTPRNVTNICLRDEILREFRSIKPSQYVAGEVDRFMDDKLKGSSAVAVHIRREDNAWSNAFCKDELFLKPIKLFLESHSNPKILLCTDGTESRIFIRKIFGEFVVEYPTRSFDRGGSSMAIQDAFINMMLMSHCDMIIRSVSSTFSQCAAWFGDIPTQDVGRPQHE